MENTQESMYKKTQWFQTSPCEACSYGGGLPFDEEASPSPPTLQQWFGIHL